ncbi:MAG: cbb3-type cytochrome c oxidase N-terminal domain-containing protein [Saprospiraceae bacterium]
MKIYKTLSSLFFFFLGTLMLTGQIQQQSKSNPFIWTLNNIILILGALAVFGVISSLLRLSFNLLSLRKAELMNDLGVEKEDILEELKRPIWKKINDWAWNIIPEGYESEIDLGHDYDGIRELDNKLPPWWLALFYGSIIYAVVYMWVYHSPGNEWSSENEYLMAMVEAEEMKKAHLALSADAVDETTVVLLTDEVSLARGAEIYFALCAVCHGQLGEGLVGPNFSDPYWVHGGGIRDLFTTIKYGVPEKGMISWRSQLRPSEIQKVASFILTFEGTAPPNQKEKEGELYDRDANSESSVKSKSEE